MALFKIILSSLSLFAFTNILSAQDTSLLTKQLLYSLHAGDFDRALELYQNHRRSTGKHDLDLVQQIGLIILDKGHRESDPEIQLLTLFGAGISGNERCLYILEEGLGSPNPKLQLVALNMLARSHHDHADEALNRALGANHLLIRLEALAHLAEKKHPKAVGQIEALMSKVDESLLPIFPQLFAIVGDDASTKALKRMMAYPDKDVRVAAILSAAKYKRDDLLPQIRKQASQHDLVQQEACAIALGMMHDEASIPRLEALVRSNNPMVRLAAQQALYRVGKKEIRQTIEAEAKNQNLYAIAMLGEMPGSENTLYELTQSTQLQVRVNAGIALLARRDPRCLKAIAEVLLHDSRDLAFGKITSLSTGLTAYKAIPAAQHHFDEEAIPFELSLGIREDVLEQARELPAKDFLLLAESIFITHQNDLVPVLAGLLENMQTKEVVELLKKYQHKAGAPLIRNYCTLALFNLKEEGPYAENLRLWASKQQEQNMIRFRPFIPLEAREAGVSYELTPEETSQFLIAVFEAFAKTQDDKGIDVLLDAIRHGNQKNRYALAGLLIRATM